MSAPPGTNPLPAAGAERWAAVDAYLEEHLLGADTELERVSEVSEREGLPSIAVSPTQGKLLHLLARLVGARRILEVGALGGYSTVWMARALPPDGRLVSLELDPRHAAIASGNVAAAGLGELVEVRVGPAADSLRALATEAGGARPFDMVFLDADKTSNDEYLRLAVPLTRAGGVIVVDNVIRAGRIVDSSRGGKDAEGRGGAGSRGGPVGVDPTVVDPAVVDPAVEGTRRFFEAARDHPGIDATAVQTVGAKGYDGFVLAVVR